MRKERYFEKSGRIRKVVEVLGLLLHFRMVTSLYLVIRPIYFDNCQIFTFCILSCFV